MFLIFRENRNSFDEDLDEISAFLIMTKATYWLCFFDVSKKDFNVSF